MNWRASVALVVYRTLQVLLTVTVGYLLWRVGYVGTLWLIRWTG